MQEIIAKLCQCKCCKANRKERQIIKKNQRKAIRQNAKIFIEKGIEKFKSITRRTD